AGPRSARARTVPQSTAMSTMATVRADVLVCMTSPSSSMAVGLIVTEATDRRGVPIHPGQRCRRYSCPVTSFDIPEALVRAEIDEAALRDNAAVLASRLAPARLRCVKANAYGHGVDLVAP